MEINLKNKWVKVGIIATILLIGGVILAKKAKAGPNSKLGDFKIPGVGGSSSSKKEIIVTDYDRAWDYKYIDGVWWATKKGTQSWTNLKSSLPAANYQIVVGKLSKYL